MTPHALDIAIGLIILLSTMIAYFRGIIREFFTLAGFALAALISYKGGHLLVPGIGKWLGALPDSTKEKADVLGLVTPTMGSYIVAYGGLFLLVFILMIVIRMLISHWINAAGLSVVDRLLGAGFGFLRGFLLVFVVYTTCLYLVYLNDADKLPDWAKQSVSVPILQGTLAWTKTHIDLDKIIENRGNGIAIKLDKVDLDKVGSEASTAATELKNEVKKEETEIQKGVAGTSPAPVPISATAAPVSSPGQPNLIPAQPAAPSSAPAAVPTAAPASGSSPSGAPSAP